MDVTTHGQLKLCLHEQTQILTDAACRVDSYVATFTYIGSYLFPYLLLEPLLPFLIFIYFKFVYFLLYNKT